MNDIIARSVGEHSNLDQKSGSQKAAQTKNEYNELLGQRLILSRTDLRALGIWQSNTTLLRLEAKGLFPRRLKIGGTATAWDHKEILDWFEERRIERARWVYANAE